MPFESLLKTDPGRSKPERKKKRYEFLTMFWYVCIPCLVFRHLCSTSRIPLDDSKDDDRRESGKKRGMKNGYLLTIKGENVTQFAPRAWNQNRQWIVLLTNIHIDFYDINKFSRIADTGRRQRRTTFFVLFCSVNGSVPTGNDRERTKALNELAVWQGLRLQWGRECKPAHKLRELWSSDVMLMFNIDS